MSQFPHAPIPGAYVPPPSVSPAQYPHQAGQPQGPPQVQQQQHQQQPGQYYQQQPSPSPYQAPNSGNTYAPQHSSSPAQPHGSSKFSVASLNQVFNQAVTTSKPAWQKLSKTVGQKLNKPSSSSYANPTHQYQNNPQNAQQYQNYPQQQAITQYPNPTQPQQAIPHQYQSTPPIQSQTNTPQYQAGPQQPTSTPQSQPTEWQSPTYTNTQQSPIPPTNYAPPVPNNYFPPQQSPSPSQAPPQSQQSAQPQQPCNQFGGQEQVQGPANPQVQYQQETGVTGVHQINPTQNVSPVSPAPQNVTPFSPDINNQGNQWPANGQMQPQQNLQNIPSPEIPQNPAYFNPTPPPQGFPTPPVPSNATSQPPQWAHTPISAPPTPANQYQTAPKNPHQFTPDQVSPPPAQQPGAPPESAPPHVESKPTASRPPSSAPPPTEFIAELPADLGYTPPSVNPLSKPAPTPPQQYQAYHAPTGSRPQSFVVPRRAVSTSSASIHVSTGPWRFVDPSTEQPTPEFFIIADLLFDGLDKKCEPKNTGFLEAPKILESWKVQEMADEPARLFMHNHYHAFASLWTLEGIPHVLVPNEPRLTPSQVPLPQSLKISTELPAPTSPYPSYVPALNRAGWYKYFFLEMVGEPEGLEKMLPAFCADTYNPATAGHPDLSRRDRSEPQSLSARANALRTGAIARVCQEAAAAMGMVTGGA